MIGMFFLTLVFVGSGLILYVELKRHRGVMNNRQQKANKTNRKKHVVLVNGIKIIEIVRMAKGKINNEKGTLIYEKFCLLRSPTLHIIRTSDDKKDRKNFIYEFFAKRYFNKIKNKFNLIEKSVKNLKSITYNPFNISEKK